MLLGHKFRTCSRRLVTSFNNQHTVYFPCYFQSIWCLIKYVLFLYPSCSLFAIPIDLRNLPFGLWLDCVTHFLKEAPYLKLFTTKTPPTFQNLLLPFGLQLGKGLVFLLPPLLLISSLAPTWQLFNLFVSNFHLFLRSVKYLSSFYLVCVGQSYFAPLNLIQSFLPLLYGNVFRTSECRYSYS